MRLNLVLLFTFLFAFVSCQKNDVNYLSENFYDHCIISEATIFNNQESKEIKYFYLPNGKLKMRLYSKSLAKGFTAMDTIFYTQDNKLGRINYVDLSNRTRPVNTLSYNWNNDKIDKVFTTGFYNNIPYVITYDYSYSNNQLNNISKTGDPIFPNYTINNFDYYNSNIRSAELQFENSSTIIELGFKSDNEENISKYAIPYPKQILFRQNLNNLVEIRNNTSFELGGTIYPINSILFKQELFFGENGNLEFLLKKKESLDLFTDGNTIEAFRYICE